jgi:hypothetical protein
MVAGTSATSDWHLQETFKALITIAVEALKLLALANGGAAVGILTYLSNLASHGTPLPAIKPALWYFAVGLGMTMAAFIVAYIAQLILYNEERGRVRGESVKPVHAVLVVVGIVLAVGSTVAFGFGCVSAGDALTSGNRNQGLHFYCTFQ